MSPTPSESKDAPRLTICYFWAGADFSALDPGRIAGLIAQHDRSRFRPIAALDRAAIQRIGIDTLRRTFERVMRIDPALVPKLASGLTRNGVEFLVDLQGSLRRFHPASFPTVREPVTIEWFGPDTPSKGPVATYRICGVDDVSGEPKAAPFPVVLPAADGGDPAQFVRALEHALRRVWRNHLALRHAPVIPVSAAFDLAARLRTKPAPMRIAVVTPYHREPIEDLRKCHESVLAQTLACTHFMVADGFPVAGIDDWDVRHVKLPVAHGSGNVATGIGALLAASEGFDAIAFLDGDNWYYPDHLQTMVALYESTLAEVCAARRDLYRLDDSFMGTDAVFDGTFLVDTNCYFITRAAFSTLHYWTRMIATSADRMYLQLLKRKGYGMAFSERPTVAYRTGWSAHYVRHGESPPEESRARSARLANASRAWTGLSARQWSSWASDIRFRDEPPPDHPLRGPARPLPPVE